MKIIRRSKSMNFFLLLLFLAAALAGLRVWTDCDYCENLTAPPNIQLCSETGSSSCSLYYMQAQTICCSNKSGPDCDSYYQISPSGTYYYRVSSGTYCNGTYRCAGRTSAPCSGDIIVPTSSDCVPYGPMIPQTGATYACD